MTSASALAVSSAVANVWQVCRPPVALFVACGDLHGCVGGASVVANVWQVCRPPPVAWLLIAIGEGVRGTRLGGWMVVQAPASTHAKVIKA
jgi:hypothetical protein